MLRYRLRTTTVALNEENSRRVVIFVPAESILTAPAGAVNDTGMVDVEWNGKYVQMFGIDLHDRGELIEGGESSTPPPSRMSYHPIDDQANSGENSSLQSEGTAARTASAGTSL
jgi:hypothetical protein